MTLPRLLLKLSGEALGGEAGFGLAPQVLVALCEDLQALVAQGTQLALVIGGGNLFRGQQLAAAGMDRVVGDRMGMLATVMNGLAVGDFLRQRGVEARVYCSVPIAGIAAGYDRDLADRDLAAGRVVILSGGTGNPFFTTDTAACLRAAELGVDAVLKATNVDGVYDADPKVHPDATRFDVLTFDDVLARGLGVMDLTAMVLCKENNLRLEVFDMLDRGALQAIARGESPGTRVVTTLPEG